MNDQLKSLAHKDWPYTGTPWAWRGFATAEMPKVWPMHSPVVNYEVAYQKLSFGPELP